MDLKIRPDDRLSFKPRSNINTKQKLFIIFIKLFVFRYDVGSSILFKYQSCYYINFMEIIVKCKYFSGLHATFES